ncbi:MAG: hypothetical protein GY782_04250 [Gammaproteobacteria bacterium]|nr:hypothetical protein [Gammaproteobacteria bacterium]
MADMIPGFHLLMEKVAALQKMVDELSQRLPKYNANKPQNSNTSQPVKKDKVPQKHGQTSHTTKGNMSKDKKMMQHPSRKDPPSRKEQASRRQGGFNKVAVQKNLPQQVETTKRRRCFSCNKLGHISKDCRVKARKNTKRKRGNKSDVAYADSEPDEYFRPRPKI